MKTQIITLETHDDLISVRDRLSWAKTPRILLVWPKFEKVTLRQVDLRILHRHAATLGAQLGLVTRQRRVRADAEALGIPVFQSTNEAQRTAWPKVRRRRWKRRFPIAALHEKREAAAAGSQSAPWRSQPATRILALALGVSAVLALVAVFIPRAQIRLQPVTRVQSIDLTVSADPAIEQVFITGSLPASQKRVVVEGTQTITVTGEGTVPQSKARGAVDFRNLTQQAVTIPAGTVVSAEQVRFTTTREVKLEAGVGKAISVPILAVEGGLAGNVEAEAIRAIEGRLGLAVAVTNPAATTGGRELSSVQPSESDRSRVKTLLLKNLVAQARDQFTQELGSGDLLFEKTLEQTRILSEKYDPPPGGVGSKLTLTLQVEYTARYASASDLTELAGLAMNASLPSGFVPAGGPVTVTAVTVPLPDAQGVLRWKIHAEREIRQAFDPAYVTQLVQGLAVGQARANLERQLPPDSAPELALAPAWWPYVPLLPIRIEVRSP